MSTFFAYLSIRPNHKQADLSFNSSSEITCRLDCDFKHLSCYVRLDNKVYTLGRGVIRPFLSINDNDQNLHTFAQDKESLRSVLNGSLFLNLIVGVCTL